jgi:hypothetical protein
VDRAEKAAVAPTPTAALTAPKFLGPLCSAVALAKAGALDLKTGLDIGLAEGGTKDALQLPASSSSALFLARACLSDHVNFLVTPGVEEGLAEFVATATASPFLRKDSRVSWGAGRLTGE